jgi:hypothetical protein
MGGEMSREPQTTAEAVEALKRAVREAFEPLALLMLRVLTPPARVLDRFFSALPLRVRQALWLLTWPGRWLPWALGATLPKMPR